VGRKLRVGVIFGGRSGEHEVSLRSAASVMAALDKAKYEIVPLGITKSGRWLAAGDPLKLLSDAAAVDAAALQAGTTPGKRSTSETAVATQSAGLMPLVQSGGARLPKLDVVFPVLHGPYGEDGTIQGLLEMAGIPYIGAGVLASAVGMDKAVQKDLFRQCGLPVVDDIIVLRRTWERDPESVVRAVEERIGYPAFVKPANLGSSVGISKARDRAELRESLNLAAQYDRKLVVEQAVPQPREIECSVLGNDDPITSVCGEIVPKREFYDYVAKYSDDSTELIVPADIPRSVQDAMREMARRAFLALDCAGMARVDFLMTRDFAHIYVSELNTIPGFTTVSMFSRLFAATGVPYSELLDRLIDLALERHADKSRVKTSWT
jgi:D-alanine-D-alanine ligase